MLAVALSLRFGSGEWLFSLGAALDREIVVGVGLMHMVPDAQDGRSEFGGDYL